MVKKIRRQLVKLYWEQDFHHIVNYVNKLFNSVKVEVKQTENHDLYVFYHLFLLNQWQDVFLQYLKAIEKSGLQKQITQIYVCAIFKEKDDLKMLMKILKKYPKTILYYKRQYLDLPVQLWHKPNIKTHTNLGEGESIMKMLEHAKTNPKESNYIFLHAKGVTNPDNVRRLQTSYFFKNGLSKSSSNEEMNAFITKKIIEKTINNWEQHLKALQTKNFYYFVFNIFWIRSDFLQKFDFNDFNTKAQFPVEYSLSNRHWSAIFPLNLYGCVFNKKIISMRNIVDLYL